MLKSALLQLSKTDGPVEGPVTKFGGQPHWLEAAQWPISRAHNVPMNFLGQIALADVPSLPEDLRASGKLAYLFTTCSVYDPMPEVWDEDAGENAVIIQPGGAPPRVETTENAVEEDEEGCVTECSVRMQTQEEPELRDQDSGQLGTSIGDGNWNEEVSKLLGPSKLGGVPEYIQAVGCRSEGGPWLPLLQLHDDIAMGDGTYLGTNFGSGMGYAYLSEDGREGRFMWQC